MTAGAGHPAFGAADLTNCERELIHLAGAVQPCGALLLLDRETLEVLCVSASVEPILGLAPDAILARPVDSLSPALAETVNAWLSSQPASRPSPMRLVHGDREYEGSIHEVSGRGIVVELEPRDSAAPTLDAGAFTGKLSRAIAALGSASSVEHLSQLTAHAVRELTGYDRVMVYRFDADGHGEVVAEERKRGLDSFLGLHYPASDIPNRARELYLRNRVRALVDVNHVQSPLVPAAAADLDMSLCYLRSMSPIHLQYLRNMGVTATLVCSIIKEGTLWGLIACHHYSPRPAPYAIRTTCDIVAQIVATRLLALEVQQAAAAEVLVRRIEQQVVESVSASGEWHQALALALHGLTDALGATGSVLAYQGEISASGTVPHPHELERLVTWLRSRGGVVFHTAALGRHNVLMGDFAREASGLLAIRLAPDSEDYLIWFRREQVETVRWAGDPRKPVVVGDDPLHLSPRRSFAVWKEQVRGTSRPWGAEEVAMAHMIQASLSDMIQQVNAVRVLIAARQLAAVRQVVDGSPQPMVLLDGDGRLVLLNRAYRHLAGQEAEAVATTEDLALCFAESDALTAVLQEARDRRRTWGGRLTLLANGRALPVAVRVDSVPAQNSALIGQIVQVTDLSSVQEAEAARDRLASTLRDLEREVAPASDQRSKLLEELISAIMTSARPATTHASDEGDARRTLALTDIETITRRAAELTRQMYSFAWGRH